jgi:hypothetical protein
LDVNILQQRPGKVRSVLLEEIDILQLAPVAILSTKDLNAKAAKEETQRDAKENSS